MAVRRPRSEAHVHRLESDGALCLRAMDHPMDLCFEHRIASDIVSIEASLLDRAFAAALARPGDAQRRRDSP